jgi:hypothetical protein
VSASSEITSTSFWLQRLRQHELSQTSAHRRAYTNINHTPLSSVMDWIWHANILWIEIDTCSPLTSTS